MTRFLLVSLCLLYWLRVPAAAQTAPPPPGDAASEQACSLDADVESLQNIATALVDVPGKLQLKEFSRDVSALHAQVHLNNIPLPGGADIVRNLQKSIGDRLHTIDDNSQPLPVQHDQLLHSPRERDSRFTPAFQDDEGLQMAKIAASVGRIGVPYAGRNNFPEFDLWGTGFVIAPGIIATNCHVVDSFAEETPAGWRLKAALAAGLVIDFSDGISPAPDRQFRVIELAGNPEQTGFDVVFLKVEIKSVSGGGMLPPPLQLVSRPMPPVTAQNPVLAALVGYPDLHHFVDAASSATYQPYQNDQYSKFVVPGGVTAVNHCRKPLDIILNAVSTTEGESGSALVDRATGEVIGIHNCCAGYSTSDGGDAAPSKMKCATIKSTFSNQAISIWSLFQEPSLCAVLRDNQSLPNGIVCPPSSPPPPSPQ